MIRNSPLNPIIRLTSYKTGRPLAGQFQVASKLPLAAPSTHGCSLRLDLVRQHGDFSLAYATAVQSRLHYFGNENGYIAYEWHKLSGYLFVLGDPVAAPEGREQLVRQFLAKHPRATFCQISATTARTVQKCGFRVNEMGVDTILPLSEYDFGGQDKRWIRQAASWTSSRGFSVREATTDQVTADEIEAVSEAWRATRVVSGREVRFLNRPLVSSEEADTRRFYLFDPGERMVAFVFFDPLYRGGRLIGYVACNKRRHPDAPSQAEQSIMKHAIEVFTREDCQEVRLGLSPLAWIGEQERGASRFVNFLFRRSFASPLFNDRFYNLQGHANYKRKYRGREEKLYLATKGGLNLVRLWALLKLCKAL